MTKLCQMRDCSAQRRFKSHSPPVDTAPRTGSLGAALLPPAGGSSGFKAPIAYHALCRILSCHESGRHAAVEHGPEAWHGGGQLHGVNDLMRIVLIGVAHWHTPFYSDPVLAMTDAAIVGVSDPDASRAAPLAAKANCPVFTDYREMCESSSRTSRSCSAPLRHGR